MLFSCIVYTCYDRWSCREAKINNFFSGESSENWKIMEIQRKKHDLMYGGARLQIPG